MTPYAALTEEDFRAEFNKIEDRYIAAHRKLGKVAEAYNVRRNTEAARELVEAREAADLARKHYDDVVAEHERRHGE